MVAAPSFFLYVVCYYAAEIFSYHSFLKQRTIVRAIQHICFLIFFLINMNCNADDTPITSFGTGGIGFLDQGTSINVSLENEKLSIQFLPTRYTVYVEFTFVNKGPSVTYDLGFPVFLVNPVQNDRKNYVLNNFTTTVNGSIVPFNKRMDSLEKNIVAWYVKRVVFAAHSSTSITVSYWLPYSQYAISVLHATYYYGSAKYWSGPIGRLSVQLSNASDYLLQFTDLRSVSNFDRLIYRGETVSELVFTNVTANPQSSFNFDLIPYTYAFSFIGEDGWLKQRKTNICLYTTMQLNLIDKYFLALHGQIFTDPATLRMLNTIMSDYNPSVVDASSFLTVDESSTVGLTRRIVTLRRSGGSISFGELFQ
jgi:hypothetical protein